MTASTRWTRRCALASICCLAALALLAGAAWTQSASAATKKLTVNIANATAGATEDPTPHGRVTSVPSGIDCPSACSAEFPTGTTVRLNAAPAAGYAVAEWDVLLPGTTCEPGLTCSLTLDDTQLQPIVTAYFQPAAQLNARTAGPGRLMIEPAQPGLEGSCRIDPENPDASAAQCTQRFVTGTKVKFTAVPDAGTSFVGWGDYACAKTSRTCTLKMVAGEQYVTARFDPVVLTVTGNAFGAITITPAPGAFCAMMADSPPCKAVYRSNTLVTLRRQTATPGLFWIGACDGNKEGKLDADVCRLRLQGNEVIGAGYASPGEIPPPGGSSITVVLDGKKRGSVSGTVITDDDAPRLSCGSRCVVKGLTVNDSIRLKATARKGSRFTGWHDGSTRNPRTVPLSAFNRIRASFRRK